MFSLETLHSHSNSPGLCLKLLCLRSNSVLAQILYAPASASSLRTHKAKAPCPCSCLFWGRKTLVMWSGVLGWSACALRGKVPHVLSLSLDNTCCMIDTALFLFTVCFLFQIFFFHYEHQIEDACPHTYLMIMTAPQSQLQAESDMEQGGCYAWHGQSEMAKTSFFSIYVGAQASPPSAWLPRRWVLTDLLYDWLVEKGAGDANSGFWKVERFSTWSAWSGHTKKAESLKKGSWVLQLLWAAACCCRHSLPLLVGNNWEKKMLALRQKLWTQGLLLSYFSSALGCF